MELRHGNPARFGIFPIIKSVYDLAMAAGRDKANHRMKSAGRKIWNRADYRAAIVEYKRVYKELSKSL